MKSSCNPHVKNTDITPNFGRQRNGGLYKHLQDRAETLKRMQSTPDTCILSYQHPFKDDDNDECK